MSGADRFSVCSGQSTGPRQWGICCREPGRRSWRARDRTGRLRLFGSAEKAQAAADSMNACWVATYPTRTEFHLLAPHPGDVHLEDLAHHLSHICRYNGAVPNLYAVAQHSVLVSRACEREAGPAAGLAGLLHDGAEAYVGDATWPLKQAAHMAEHCAVEDRIQAVIYERFGVDPEAHAAVVKYWDAAVLLAEARDFLGSPAWAFERVGRPGMEPFPAETIEPWGPLESRWNFMGRFEELAA